MQQRRKAKRGRAQQHEAAPATNEARAIPAAVAPLRLSARLLPQEVRVDLAWAAAVLGLTCLAFLLLRFVPGVALPVLLSLGLAWALDPLVDLFEARGWSRTLAIVALGGVLGVAIGAALAFLVPALIDQATRLPGYLQALAGRALPLAEELLGEPLPADWHQLATEFSGRASAVAAKIGPAAGRLLLQAAGGTATAVSQILGLALVPLFLFYFLRDFDEMKGRATALLPPRHRAQIVGRFREIDEVLAAFVRGQATVAAILGAIYAAGLTLAGVKLGLVIGLVAGIASLVPFAGVAIGAVLAAVAVLVDWHEGSLWVAAGAAATFAVGQALEGSVITPRVVGEKVGLPAVVVMLAVLAFGELLGFAGLLLAVPLAALLKVVLRVLVARYRASDWYVAAAPVPGEEKAAAGDFSP